MLFYSLNNHVENADFREATLRGQAPDGGLYFPERIPAFEASWLSDIENIPDHEIAYRVIAPYVGRAIPEKELKRIVAETLDFPIPLKEISSDIFSLELFHGPTLAFKDVGARFMSRCLGYFSRDRSERVVVLVATSGDTGGAVANGFYNVPGVEVVILYPSGKVSQVQEKQLTTMGKNVHALEVKGSFDDCQRMVKTAFADESLKRELFLTSANSINIARWLPQQFYYLLAWKQWPEKEQPPVFCVPSGNFGNICAGLLAHRSGMPASHFLAACNANRVVPDFMLTQQYHPQPAVATISNAMDVGDPSNFVRVLELFGRQFPRLADVFSSVSITDDQTREAIRRVWQSHHYLLDPHGAVAWVALQAYLQQHPGRKGLILETAHPVKFYDVVEPLLDEPVPVPEKVKDILQLEKRSQVVPATYDALADFLRSMG